MSDNTGLVVLVLAAGAAALLWSSGAVAAFEPDNGAGDGSTDYTALLDGAGDDLMSDLGVTNSAPAGDPNANVQAFLDMIAYSEGTYGRGDNGYNVVVGGSLFSSYDQHPRIVVNTRYGLSDAAGRYQIMAAVPGQIKTNTWDWISARLGLTDFSPASQDAVAIYIMQWKGAYNDVLAGNIESAIAKLRGQWASFPASPYGQTTNAMQQMLAWYQAQGGTVA
ncbi:glycoside hydrolase family 24 protein [Burkholderia gladioli]|uniref:glycoside hydrolase family 24 protein n=1 Tax=Burkholderia gladioli TaxID=28095 RepID=UPI00163FC136|nr:glycoside hydrolase family 104 protein [Burkholderia gladioli]